MTQLCTYAPQHLSYNDMFSYRQTDIIWMTIQVSFWKFRNTCSNMSCWSFRFCSGLRIRGLSQLLLSLISECIKFFTLFSALFTPPLVLPLWTLNLLLPVVPVTRCSDPLISNSFLHVVRSSRCWSAWSHWSARWLPYRCSMRPAIVIKPDYMSCKLHLRPCSTRDTSLFVFSSRYRLLFYGLEGYFAIFPFPFSFVILVVTFFCRWGIIILCFYSIFHTILSQSIVLKPDFT